MYSALDLVDDYYQLLMREHDIPLTAVNTPSGVLWEWLVMPQGLSIAPDTFNRLVTHLFRPHRGYAQTYFNDIFVNCCAEGNFSNVQAHIWHLKQVFQFMQDNKLYANLKKCFFCAPKNSVLGCYESKSGVRTDPEKVSSICSWHTRKNSTELRQCSVWQIICIRILQRIMLAPYSLFHHFERNTPRIHSFPSIKRPSMQ